MKSIGIVAAASCLVMAAQAHAEDLATYVNTCKSQLGITAIPSLDCNNGVRFAFEGGDASLINDFLVYSRLTDTVDLALACRWLSNPNGPYFETAFSAEMLVHDRFSGKTCFFAARPHDFTTPNHVSVLARVSTSLSSPTSAGASDVWMSPDEVNTVAPGQGQPTSSLKCVGCHVAGPYIASPRIAPYLARFGLLNNGHDTFATRYNALGSTFAAWNSIIASNNLQPEDSVDRRAACAAGCHSIGYKSTTQSIFIGQELIPALVNDTSENVVLPAIAHAGVMPPTNNEYSDYRWTNADWPTSDGADYETIDALRVSYPKIWCAKPDDVAAHAVGNEVSFSALNLANMPDKLRAFNLRDGLVCLDADQPAGKKCSDYSVRYECSNGGWSNFYNMDTVTTDDGDHEDRSRIQNICAFGTVPINLEARFLVQIPGGGSFPSQVIGPTDRLYIFDTATGFICRNQDQPSGQSCANYVARFDCPSNQAITLVSSWSKKVLTATNTTNDSVTQAQPDNPSATTQDWVLEPVAAPFASAVRFKSVASGRYLNVLSQSDGAAVSIHDLSASSQSEMWWMERVAGTNDYRFRNVSSSLYLTVGNLTTTAPMITKAFMTAGSQQRFHIQ